MNRITATKAAILFAFGLSAATAADNEPSPVPESGYIVLVDVNVTAAGTVEDVKLVSSDSYDLGRMAPAFARQMTFKPRLEGGQPVASVQRVPLFFPVEGDGGPEANRGPRPTLKVPVQPNYPFELRRSGTPGGAIFHLRVDAKGKVTDVKVVRASHAGFGTAGKEALKKWKFTPPLENGQPVATEFNFAMAFELEGKVAAWKWYVAPRPALSGAFIISGAMIPLRN